MAKPIDKRLGLLNEANPVEFAATEYCCAMKYLDTQGVPRRDTGRKLSLVGRIRQFGRLTEKLSVRASRN